MFYILTTVSPLSYPSIPFPISLSNPQIITSLFFFRKARAPMSVSQQSKVYQIEVGLPLRLKKTVQYLEERGSWKPDKELGTVLLPTLGIPHLDQTTQLSHICKEPRSVPYRLPSCHSRVCDLLWAQVTCFWGSL